MADRKGMSSVHSKMPNDGITFEDLNNTFKIWDDNNDGFIDPEEVRLIKRVCESLNTCPKIIQLQL